MVSFYGPGLPPFHSLFSTFTSILLKNFIQSKMVRPQWSFYCIVLHLLLSLHFNPLLFNSFLFFKICRKTMVKLGDENN